MTRIIITLLASILSLLVNAQESQQVLSNLEKGIDIAVSVNNITSNKGKVYFTLYSSKDNFYQRVAFSKETGEIKENSTRIIFSNVPKGTYAIICFHDANDNNQMDFDGYMPVEDYGTSNNSRSMGPPQFEPAKFEVVDVDLKFEIIF
ncbi:MAG TPA: DUF2141 domain-containing protein [Lutibacter sp.]|nr:DUF2141 domain-containing protein [Lutibacter sp.]